MKIKLKIELKKFRPKRPKIHIGLNNTLLGGFRHISKTIKVNLLVPSFKEKSTLNKYSLITREQAYLSNSYKEYIFNYLEWTIGLQKANN